MSQTSTNRLLAGASLLLMLLAISCQREEQNQQSLIDYQTARKVFWQELYPDQTETLYCQQSFDPASREKINIEHVFPMSWVTSALDCGTRKQCRSNNELFNRVEADLHNLYPSRSDVNHDRGAMRFGEVGGEARRYGQHCDMEVDHRGRKVEPPPSSRGNIARAMFYMAWQYREAGLEIYASSGDILQQWNLQDPPDAEERARNDRIEQLQGNRNPFIDDPTRLDSMISGGEFYR